MDTNTLLGFAGVIALLLLWSWYSKERGFGGGLFAALVTLAVLVALGYAALRLGLFGL